MQDAQDGPARGPGPRTPPARPAVGLSEPLRPAVAQPSSAAAGTLVVPAALEGVVEQPPGRELAPPADQVARRRPWALWALVVGAAAAVAAVLVARLRGRDARGASGDQLRVVIDGADLAPAATDGAGRP